MKSKPHVTLSGHTIELPELADDVAAFLARLAAQVDDPTVTEQQMIGLAYSSENPILDHALFPGRGSVTKEVLADPAYQVVTDLLARKHVAAAKVDPAELARDYTLTVGEAAAALGIHESAVRQAIAARRLPSWVKDGRTFLSPRSVASYRLTLQPRGPEPEEGRAKAKARARRVELVADDVDVGYGSHDGWHLRFFTNGVLEDLGQDGTVRRGVVRNWTTLCFLTTHGDSVRFWRVRPGRVAHATTAGAKVLYVDGKYQVIESVNNPRRANEAWRDRARSSKCWAALEVERAADGAPRRVAEEAFRELVELEAGGFELPGSGSTRDLTEALRSWCDLANRSIGPDAIAKVFAA